jgi:hypothetical protein
MIVVLTHARGYPDENLVFAWLWNITLAEFDRLANFGNEDCFLLGCHVVVVVVSVLLFQLIAAQFSPRCTTRRDTYTIITATFTCNIASLHLISHSRLVPNIA